jgi:hypothetical protein
MKIMKRILLGLLLIIFSVTLFAKKVELQDARAIALNAYYKKINMYYEKVDFNKLLIVDHFVINDDGATVYYIFNFANNGFIIVSAEDAMTPILGYSFKSSYSQENSPENFIGWMNGRAGAIKYLRENNIEFDHTSFVGKDYGENVEPLLTCIWDQGSPYNYLCPVNTSGETAVVGCVATAMAQIMYYWRYPEQGEGSKSYTWGSYGTISANFGETTYDWDGMLDNPYQINIPVALISFHTGVSVEMMYGTNGSGAYSDDVDDALKAYFGYGNTCNFIARGGTAWATWKNIIQGQLDDKYPVYYSGADQQTGGSGHAFVLDGSHSDGTYHFNFGWSGYANGWYEISDPAGYEWYYWQSMVRNIIPGDPDYPYGCVSNYVRTNLVGSFEDGSGPTDYDQNVDCSWLIDPQTEQDSVTKIKLNFISLETDSGDLVTIYDGSTTSDPVLGTFSGSVTPTDDIFSTGNKMLITFVGDGNAVTGNGFKVEYSTILPSWCSGNTMVTAPSGSFDDGSGDFWYNYYGSSCTWMIAPEWASDITLSFTEFHTEEDVDRVKVYDPSNNQLLVTLSGEYTAGNLPDPIYNENGALFIIFQANGVNNAPGWTVEWEIGNTGIDAENAEFNSLMIYPNPTDNLLNVSFKLEDSQTFEVKLISVTGNVVYKEVKDNFSGHYVNTIDLSKMAKGVYFLNLTNETGSINKKVVVK